MNIPEMFGSMVCNDRVMKERLPKEVYRDFHALIEQGGTLTLSMANVIANTMKDWALEKGATHFTHWFQPLTGITAEKHDGFLCPLGDGSAIMEFTGKELIRGESDASSFPSGGLRATFEARGYTAWDPTSPAFIKDNTLCIPTAFCSYGGHALDNKTPLLRSLQALEKQVLRILRLFDPTVKSISVTMGAEQEYFLLDETVYRKRPDLLFTGRTLFGARPPKGQELDDHYSGNLKPRVSAFMKELDEELWKLGVPAKTEHNEAAPAQHELAPQYENTNLAADHNQLTMETMKKLAPRHGMVCLLHEKPFAGVNGSGKHNNWSLCTDTGRNLLEPGSSPHDNALFLLFLCAVIAAVDDHQDMLRASVASTGNEHRLGGNEAPPSILSVFLGDELTGVLEALEAKQDYDSHAAEELEIGVSVLPHLPKDTTDRNRTSPFAFTGNKFEFRSPGASASVSCPNVIINTAVADELAFLADRLEKAEDKQKELAHLIRKLIREHKRIIFNGNSYSAAWAQEAEKRGLQNLRSAPETLKAYIEPKNIALFARHGVFTETEMAARYDIYLENYVKTLDIEALTMLDMTEKSILPAALRYSGFLTQLLLDKRSLAPNLPNAAETALLHRIAALTDTLSARTELLRQAMAGARAMTDIPSAAAWHREKIFTAMQSLRETVDELEMLVAREYWPFPTYSDLLFSVR